MIKRLCDLCGKEISLDSSIEMLFKREDRTIDRWDVCGECKTVIKKSIKARKKQMKKGKEEL